MSHNLLLWKWSDDFDTPAKRKKAKLKFGDVTTFFAKTGDHPAIGEANINAFVAAIEVEYGTEEHSRTFVLERYSKCVVFNYSSSVRIELVPKVAAIGTKFGLNASEF